MKLIKMFRWGGGAVPLVLATMVACAATAWCQTQDGAAQNGTPKHGKVVSWLRTRLHRSGPFEDGIFQRAESAFPEFCKDWESKLKARERNNVEHITWQSKDGYETGTYVGYGDIKSCTCKQTAKGIPVGKLSYQEFEYYLQGPSRTEAEQASPKTAGVTNTTEIFRYDRKLGRWVY